MRQHHTREMNFQEMMVIDINEIQGYIDVGDSHIRHQHRCSQKDGGKDPSFDSRFSL